MSVSVVVPTHKRNESLLVLLESLKSQGSDLGEVIVVSNLKDSFFDKSKFKKATESLPIKVLTVGMVGANRARNIGLKAAKNDVVLLLDDDCELTDSTYLEKVLKCHQRNKEVVAIGGTYELAPEAAPIDVAYNLVGRYWQASDNFGDYYSSRLIGGNVSYKKSLLELGDHSFDESILFGGTESEFHKRLNREGLKTVFFDSLKVQHNTALDLISLVRKAYLQALAAVHHEIDQGYNNESQRSYHTQRAIWAFEHSGGQDEFQEIIFYMDVYDWAYNFVVDNPEASERFVLKKVQKTLKRKPTTLSKAFL